MYRAQNQFAAYSISQNALVLALQGYGTVGDVCRVTLNTGDLGDGNEALEITAGNAGDVLVGGTSDEVAAQPIDIDVGGSQPRVDVVYVDGNHDVQVAKGDGTTYKGGVGLKAFDPHPPDLSGDEGTPLAIVAVADDATAIDANDLGDYRVNAKFILDTLTVVSDLVLSGRTLDDDDDGILENADVDALVNLAAGDAFSNSLPLEHGVDLDTPASVHHARFTIEEAQNAIGAIVDATLEYVSGTSLGVDESELDPANMSGASGADGQVLQTDGTDANWAAAGGGGAWEELAEYTPSSQANLDITGQVSASHVKYVIQIIELVPVDDDTNLVMQYSDDDGSSFITSYDMAVQDLDTGSWGGFGNSDMSEMILTFTGIGNAAGEYVSGDIHIVEPASNRVTGQYAVGTYGSSDGRPISFFATGGPRDPSQIDAFRLGFESGNIDSGTVKLLGLKA